MSLITDIEKLRELEQQAHYPYLVYVMPDMKTPCYCRTEEDARYVQVSRNLAPVMLSVLECFREEDAETLGEILDVFQFDGEPMSGVYADCISRLQKAARLMEQEEREG